MDDSIDPDPGCNDSNDVLLFQFGCQVQQVLNLLGGEVQQLEEAAVFKVISHGYSMILVPQEGLPSSPASVMMHVFPPCSRK